MAFHDLRESVEYVVDQYFQRKKSIQSNIPQKNGQEIATNAPWQGAALPEYPFKVIRNDNGKAYKFIYGDWQALAQDPQADVVIWQEEILYDDKGKFLGIKKVYPDGGEIVLMKKEAGGAFAGFVWQ